MEVKNTLTGLDLVDRVSEELRMKVCTLYRSQYKSIPKRNARSRVGV